MNWNSRYLTVLLLAVLLSFCSVPKEQREADVFAEEIASEYLLNISEVAHMLNQPGYKIIDFRKETAYTAGHLPGAIHIWRSDIENPDFEYEGMMATRSQLEALFSEKGILSGDTLLIYDDNGLCDAARLWWVLQNHGYEAVKLLHGGMRAWQSFSDSISFQRPAFEPTSFRFSNPEQTRLVITKEQMQEGLRQGVFVLDVRSADEFSGKRQKKGASKGGRIPGSVNIDWASAIDFHGDLKLKPADQLRQIYRLLPDDKEVPIVLYCHTGVRSAHTTFVLTELLGYKNVKNYDGSWTEWSYFDDLAFEKDSITTLID